LARRGTIEKRGGIGMIRVRQSNGEKIEHHPEGREGTIRR